MGRLTASKGEPLDFLEFFSTSYAQARIKFLAACSDHDVNVVSYKHPKHGPGGEPLYLDAAYHGPAAAGKLLVIVSGTHGGEGYAGSACQTGWLRHGRGSRIGEDCGVLLIHAHNPYGFAWGIRHTHENVDLNRNFIDHAAAPDNELCNDFYTTLGEFPDTWSEAFFHHFQDLRRRFYQLYGEEETEKWLGYGQYKHPHGLHYGGNAPTWSNKILTEILSDCGASAREVILIDIHTGLGRYGYGEILSLDAGESAEFKRSREIFGDSVYSMPDGLSAASYSVGNVSAGVRTIFPNATVTAHALEFGTYEGPSLQPVKIGYQWILARGSIEAREADNIRDGYRKIFYPEHDDWKEMVWRRSMMVFRQAVDRLQ